MPSIMLMARERSVSHKATYGGQALKEARKETIKTWQAEWDRTEKGRWTYTLIRNVEKWTSRRHGDIDFYLTQALTNHGCFNRYLCRMKRSDTPKCRLCDADSDDANHTLFVCDAFANWWRQLFGEIGQDLTPDNLVDNMLQERSKWQIIATYINRVMKFKCDDERRRQSLAIINS